ncbi:MAG TPA: hypothetical protein VK806_00800 [Bacteroidia bacterium]|jgi:hypothetical protein|nr:hypothetical protein [Bacteroidia bacterium]
MKKTFLPLVALALLAISLLGACKSSERCEAYRDSRANTHQAIQDHHARG